MPSDTRDGVVTAAVEHPLPTGATKKFLYAHAFRCACPGCPRPLYSVDGETGARSLNSQIAHICARREGGPRFDLQQSAEENRHETNLLVLCLEHANEVDVAGWETRAVAAVPAGVPWLISVALPVEAAGRWRFELLGGGVVLAHLPLEVSINANAVAHG